MIHFILILLLHAHVQAALNGHCPPLGPVLHAPTSPSTNPTIRAAIASLNTYFTSLTPSLSSTGLSLSIQSLHEPATKLVDLHYTPPNTTVVVDADTVYRVGSVSKIFTVLAVLQAGIRLDDLVITYLPELADLVSSNASNDTLSSASWADITIGALASHMAGLGLDLQNDLLNLPQPWSTTLGFPPGNTTDDGPGCMGLYNLPVCNESELYRDFPKHHPVFPPFTSPSYSNLGLAILGLVLERVSGATFAMYMQNAVITPLGLTGTGLNETRGFVPPGLGVDETMWGVDMGWDNPAGGFFSTANDLLTLGSAILNGSVLGSAATRKWLKPVASTSTTGRMIGAPWEILRSNNLTVDNRLIDIPIKSGDDGVYHTKLALLPDYDLVVAQLSAGPQADYTFSFQLLSNVLAILVPALEQASKDEAAAAGYTGTFTNGSSSMTLALDDGPGLAVSSWVVRGHNVLTEVYPSVAGVGSAVVRPRMYPTGLVGSDKNNNTIQTESWRVVFDLGTPEEVAASDAGFAWAGQSCQTWAGMDRFPYAFRSIDEVVFRRGADDGRVVGLVSRGFEVEMSPV